MSLRSPRPPFVVKNGENEKQPYDKKNKTEKKNPKHDTVFILLQNGILTCVSRSLSLSSKLCAVMLNRSRSAAAALSLSISSFIPLILEVDFSA